MLGSDMHKMYRRLLYAIVLLHWSVLLAACWAVSSAHVHPLAVLGMAPSLDCSPDLQRHVLFSVGVSNTCALR